MTEPGGLKELAQRFEDWVWQGAAPDLREREEPFRRDCASAGIPLTKVLAEQSDETLAVAVQKDFCLGPVFEELWVKRFESKVLMWLHSWERRFGRDYHWEFDLAQELALKIYVGRLKTYDPKHPFGHWLSRVAHNHRVARVVRPRKARPSAELVQAVTWTTPEDEATARDLAAAIDGKVARLPPDERLLMQRMLQGMSPGEIAQELGCGVQWVYRVMFRLRKWLVEELMLDLPPSNRGRPPKARPEGPEAIP
jgi:RNA polymerase sigma factor (sigma-70 family)